MMARCWQSRGVGPQACCGIEPDMPIRDSGNSPAFGNESTSEVNLVFVTSRIDLLHREGQSGTVAPIRCISTGVFGRFGAR